MTQINVETIDVEAFVADLAADVREGMGSINKATIRMLLQTCRDYGLGAEHLANDHPPDPGSGHRSGSTRSDPLAP